MAAHSYGATDFRLTDSHSRILSRGNHLATARLNLQHFLWQRILRFTIHPKLAAQLPEEPVIADVAAGTCLWSVDVSHEFPKARLHAHDIDLTQAAPQAWLPANVRIGEWDIFENPSFDLIGRYDLVHVRLLVLVLSGLDPIPVLRRMRSLLKPGGWPQWEELDCTRMHVKRVLSVTPAPSMEAIIDMSRSGGRHDWVVGLPEMLGELGHVETGIEEFDDPVELCRALNDQLLMTIEEFASGLARMGKVGTADRVMALVGGVYGESMEGPAICYPRVCCVAKKA